MPTSTSEIGQHTWYDEVAGLDEELPEGPGYSDGNDNGDEDSGDEDNGEYVGCREVAEDMADKVTAVILIAFAMYLLLARI